LKKNNISFGTIFFNPDFLLDQKFVIPAKAGIQLVKNILQSRSKPRFCPLLGMYILLDSRLRGNDGDNRKLG
jgi:hypothetical protein